MIFSKIGFLPYHIYCWIDPQFTHAVPEKFQQGMVVGITSIPGRSWGFSVIFSAGGAMYRQIPPHALAFCSEPPSWSLDQSQLWNCYSDFFTIIHNPVLKGMRMSVKIQNEIYQGEYLFHSAHLGDGWSLAPEQDKEFFFIKLDNGRLTIQPTNTITFLDPSFVEFGPLPRLKLNETVYSCSENF